MPWPGYSDNVAYLSSGALSVTQSAEVIEEITVCKGDKEAILGELAVIDFNEAALFQDVYGFAQASKRMRIPHLLPGAYRRRADHHYQLGEYDKAVDDYTRFHRSWVRDWTYLPLAGKRAGGVLGGMTKPIDDYNRADGDNDIVQRGIQDVVLYNRGNSKAELGDLQGAIQDYTEAIQVDPTTPQFYYNRGNAYLDLCDSQEALNDFNVASNLYGSPAARSINSLHNQGIALLATGRLSQALEIYRSASGIGNGHEGIYQNLWTLNRIVVLVQGLDYSLRAVPDGDTERIALRFSLPKGYEPVGRELDRLLLFGRAGNSGNTGGPGLVGGQGFDGKPFMRVYCDTDEQ